MAIVAIGILVAFLTVILLNVGGWIGYVIGALLYGIAKPLMWLLDFVQTLFRKFAGLGTTYYKDANGVLQTQEEDILLSMLTSKSVLQTFMAMCLVGICLLIIASVVQMIRVEYTTEGSKNNKFTILGSALKGFSYFFIVPIACVFGIITANYILKAVDLATSQKSASTISGTVFVSAAYQANRVRYDYQGFMWLSILESAGPDAFVTYDAQDNEFENDNDKYQKICGVNNISAERNRENVADKVDEVFSRGSKISTISGATPLVDPWQGSDLVDDYLSYDNFDAVSRFYVVEKIDYLMLFSGLCLCIVSLFKATFGMIMRIYNVVILFVISPGILGIYPIDNGNAFKSWRGKFVGNVLSAYGVVVALNLYFLIASSFRDIYLFSSSELGFGWGLLAGLMNATCQSLFTIVGALMIPNISSTISGLIGAEDGLKSGTEMSGKVGGAIGKGFKTVTGFAGGAFALGAKGFNSLVNKIQKRSNEDDNNTINKQKDRIKKRDDLVKELNDPNSGLDDAQKEKLKTQIDAANKDINDHQEEYETATNRQSDRALRNARVERVMGQAGGMFKRNFLGSSIGKSLNTMTGELIPAFGGKGVEEVEKYASERHGYTENSEILKNWEKDHQGNVGVRMQNLLRGQTLDAFGTSGKGRAGEMEDNAKANVAAYNASVQLTEFKEKMKEVADTIDKEFKSLLANLNNAIKDYNNTTVGSAERKTANDAVLNALGALEEKGLYIDLKGNNDKLNQVGNIKNITANGVELEGAGNVQWNQHGQVYSEALQPNANYTKLDAAAEALQKAGHAIQTMAEKALQERNDYAEKSGKPEVAITALTSQLRSDNNQAKTQNDAIIRLLGEMVKKLEKK